MQACGESVREIRRIPAVLKISRKPGASTSALDTHRYSFQIQSETRRDQHASAFLRTMAESEKDDTNEILQHIVSANGPSLVSHLRAVEQNVVPVRKAHEWANHPLCLAYQQSSDSCVRMVRNRCLRRPFVAVSWTWQPSRHENGAAGSYSVLHSHPRKLQTLTIRERVLARISSISRK